jgi:hypothetical protein
MTSKLVPASVAATVALTLVPASARPGGASEAPASTPAVRFGTWGIDLAGMDRSVRPGEDFFRFVNGKWAETTPIPPDKTRYGAFEVLRDLSEVRVREILDRWAADPSLAPGSDEAKVAATYRTFLDEKSSGCSWGGPRCGAPSTGTTRRASRSSTARTLRARCAPSPRCATSMHGTRPSTSRKGTRAT